MIQISQIRLRPDHEQSDLEKAVRRKLRLKEEACAWSVHRQSVDARKKPDIFYVYTVNVCFQDPSLEERVLKRCRKDSSVKSVSLPVYTFPSVNNALSRNGDGLSDPSKNRPVVVGAGPAGLFCALMLSRSGLNPVVIERGECVDERVKAVDAFWNGGPLDPDCNVQFGEGGAGTFSDGKLNTSIKDPDGRIAFVLRTFAEAGAPGDIQTSYRPHIGTDILRTVVKNIREEIITRGGAFLFSHRLTDITDHYTLHLQDIKAHTVKQISTDTLVLALGHSARDTFEMLKAKGVAMEQKAFAVGVRIQHPQKMIDNAMYGDPCPYEMPPASYKLTGKAGGRGVYSFCMCPGGYIVNASSEKEMLCVNGMSYRARSSGQANAAIVVTLSPEEYDPAAVKDPLQGMYFQRELERKAFIAGEGAVPVQTFKQFCSAADTPGSSDLIRPAIKGAWKYADVRSIFPVETGICLEEGIAGFERQIPGFASDEALLCGVESRTSSPVRILRDASCVSKSHPGIYPCGEGAGYAGGITSAAIDGIRVAEAIVRSRFT